LANQPAPVMIAEPGGFARLIAAALALKEPTPS
jgi:hypothetical protein